MRRWECSRQLVLIIKTSKQKHKHTFSDISIWKMYKSRRVCQTFKSLWRIRHTYTCHDDKTACTSKFFSFLFFIQWFYVHFQLLCHIFLVLIYTYGPLTIKRNIVIVIVFPVYIFLFHKLSIQIQNFPYT